MNEIISYNAKVSNIIDMAITFTTMTRLFKIGSKELIGSELRKFIIELSTIAAKGEFEQMHRGFCNWFCQNILTASKVLKNGVAKPSQPASYGQGAKVLDIALKVCVFYCSLPNPATASQINPFLHGGVDTPIMNHLKLTYPDTEIPSTTIQGIDKIIYDTLQDLIVRDIRAKYKDEILPVQYDDILWNKLNR